MSNSIAIARTAFVLGLALLIGGAAASADWLVTQDGQRIETKGPWKVKGKMVLFTLPNGTFSSLRLDSIDLEASRSAGKEKKQDQEASETQETQKIEPILVLTDADVMHRPDTAPGPGAQGGLEAPGGQESAEESEAISVTSWQRLDGVDGAFDVVGFFANQGQNMASDIQVSVMLYDEEGNLIDAVSAVLTSRALGPGEQGQFTAAFEVARDFVSMRFETSSLELEDSSEGS